jgi:hypothetical protein
VWNPQAVSRGRIHIGTALTTIAWTPLSKLLSQDRHTQDTALLTSEGSDSYRSHLHKLSKSDSCGYGAESEEEKVK